MHSYVIIFSFRNIENMLNYANGQKSPNKSWNELRISINWNLFLILNSLIGALACKLFIFYSLISAMFSTSLRMLWKILIDGFGIVTLMEPWSGRDRREGHTHKETCCKQLEPCDNLKLKKNPVPQLINCRPGNLMHNTCKMTPGPLMCLLSR